MSWTRRYNRHVQSALAAVFGSLCGAAPLYAQEVPSANGVAAQAVAQPAQPNIIIILVDDMGFSDLSLFGSENPTPNINALGKGTGGLIFTRFHNAARCSPSRASLLMGLYPHQAGLGHMQGENEDDDGDGIAKEASDGLLNDKWGTDGQLSQRGATLAEVLHYYGYSTMMAGKWHVGGSVGTPADESGTTSDTIIGTGSTPTSRGFDNSLELPTGLYYPDQGSTSDSKGGARCAGQTAPFILVNDTCYGSDSSDFDAQVDRLVEGHYMVPYATAYPKDGSNEKWYSTDLIEGWAERQIDQSDRSKPFFLYLAFTAPHWNVRAPQQLIDDVEADKLYDDGWSGLAGARFGKQTTNKIYASGTKSAMPTPYAYNWNKLTADSDVPDKELTAYKMQMNVYAAAMRGVDAKVKKLRDFLRSKRLLDNTIILFLSDNGAAAEGGPDTAAALIKQQPDICNPNSSSTDDCDATSPNRYGGRNGGVELGVNWATVQNTPYAYAKHFTEEGGTATPLLVSWPAKMTASKVVDTPGHIVDIAPTLLEAAGVDVQSTEYVQRFQQSTRFVPLPGESFYGAYAGEWTRKKGIFWNHDANKAVIRADGKWKAVYRPKKDSDYAASAYGEWRLYRYDSDPAETENVACKGDNQKKILDPLIQSYSTWRSQTYVEPGNVAYFDPKRGDSALGTGGFDPGMYQADAQFDHTYDATCTP